MVIVLGACGLLGFGMLQLQQAKSHRILRINQASPELQAAVRKAQSSLPNFIKELKAANPDARFAIKGTFPTDAGNEYLWVKDPTVKGSVFTGTLDQVPIALKTSSKGDTVPVNQADVVDWLIRDSAGNRGGFTERVLTK